MIEIRQLIPPSKAQYATLNRLGWELTRLRLAIEVLAARVSRGSVDDSVLAFLRPILAGRRREPFKRMTGTSVTVNLGARLNLPVVCFDADYQPAFPSTRDDALTLALFWLPALTPFWCRALRRSHWQHLRLVLPRAWFLHASPLPPGAVLPGLGTHSWLALTGSFLVVSKTGPITRLVAPLDESAAGCILIDAPPHDQPGGMNAVYRIADRVTLESASWNAV